MTSTRRLLATGLTVLAVTSGATSAAAEEPTTLSLTTPSVTSTKVSVRGVLRLGADALAPVAVSTDGAGDVQTAGMGFDLGNTTFQLADPAGTPTVVVKMAVNDGNATFAGAPPANGYSWPITVDGNSAPNYWLAAGTQGTNNPPQTGNWVGLCTVTTGWACTTPLAGSVTASAVTWQLPLGGPAAVKAGSVVDAGGVYGGVPASFAWPSGLVFAPTAPYDTAGLSVGYRVPGGVEIAITDSPDTAPEEYTSTGAVNLKTGTFSVLVDRPAAGEHTIWVRSCFGASDAPTCLVASRPLTL